MGRANDACRTFQIGVADRDGNSWRFHPLTDTTDGEPLFMVEKRKMDSSDWVYVSSSEIPGETVSALIGYALRALRGYMTPTDDEGLGRLTVTIEDGLQNIANILKGVTK